MCIVAGRTDIPGDLATTSVETALEFSKKNTKNINKYNYIN